MASWLSLRNPIRALAIKRELEAEAKEDEKQQPEDEPERAKRWVTARDVKAAVEERDFEAAQTAYRRMWRTFPVGSGNSYGRVFYGGPRAFAWPRDADTSDDAKQRAEARARGGLALFEEDDAEPVERRSAYDVLAAYDFGEAELRRQVRMWNAWQTASGGPVIGGLVKAMIRRLGKEGARDVLMGAVEKGRAGKLEYAMLLVLLQEDTALVSDEALEILADLSRTLKPTDVAQIRKLAKVWARLGGQAEASRLYRWCAAQSGGSRNNGMVMVGPGTWMSTSGGGGGGSSLVKEVGEEIDGELKIETIERILALSDPGYVEGNPMMRDPYESLVLATWIEVLGPDEALVRCRELCEEVGDTSKGLRRGAARTAAWLLARAGEHEAALSALEVALCKLDAPAGTPRWYESWYQNPGSLSEQDIRRLVPRDDDGWTDRIGWIRALSERLVEWDEAERTRPGATFQPLAIAALRLHDAGEGEAARALLGHIREFAKESPNAALWVVDVARRIGDENAAYALEQTLLTEGQLNMNRLGEVVRRMAERDGPGAALAAGEKAAEITLDAALLEALVEAAEQADRPERASHWRSVAEEAEAAREALKPKDDDDDDA